MPQASPQGKPSRLWLYAPFVLVAVAVVAWSAYWFGTRQALIQAVEAEVARLHTDGYELSWANRQVGGYPFRLDVTLVDPQLRTPGGWTVSCPRLEAEAFLHSPGHWIMATPKGFTFSPAKGGPVEVRGSTLRASFQDLTRRPPSVSMEGVGLRFKSLDAGKAFALTRAARLELHLRPGPDHQGAVFFRLEGGLPTPGTALGQWAGSQPVSAEADALLNALDHAGTTKDWSAAGGAIRVRHAVASAGSITARTSGQLTLDPQGQISGKLPLSLSKGDTALGHQDLVFDGGHSRLGPPVYP